MFIESVKYCVKLDESRVVVFCEIIPFLHDVNVKQGECITEITWADGLPLLPRAFLISLHKGTLSL